MDNLHYTYEGNLVVEDEGGYTVIVPQFDVAASGDSIAEACTEASGCLQLLVAEYVARGDALPESVFSDSPQVILTGIVTSEFVAETECLTVTEAAEYLGVTKGRISQLVKSGQLDTKEFHGRPMVTIESLNHRRKDQPGAGRPRKAHKG